LEKSVLVLELHPTVTTATSASAQMDLRIGRFLPGNERVLTRLRGISVG